MGTISLLKEKVVKKAIASVLDEVRLKINEGWTQKVLSRDKFGSEISPYLPGAASYSIIGALLSTKTHPRLELLIAKLIAAKIKAIDPKAEFRSIREWNDNPLTQQHMVLKALDLAIAYVKSP